MSKRRITTLLLSVACARLFAQAQVTSPPLTLTQARALALKNHPQVLESEALSLKAGQLTRESRSAY